MAPFGYHRVVRPFDDIVCIRGVRCGWHSCSIHAWQMYILVWIQVVCSTLSLDYMTYDIDIEWIGYKPTSLSWSVRHRWLLRHTIQMLDTLNGIIVFHILGFYLALGMSRESWQFLLLMHDRPIRVGHMFIPCFIVISSEFVTRRKTHNFLNHLRHYTFVVVVDFISTLHTY